MDSAKKRNKKSEDASSASVTSSGTVTSSTRKTGVVSEPPAIYSFGSSLCTEANGGLLASYQHKQISKTHEANFTLVCLFCL